MVFRGFETTPTPAWILKHLVYSAERLDARVPPLEGLFYLRSRVGLLIVHQLEHLNTKAGVLAWNVALDATRCFKAPRNWRLLKPSTPMMAHKKKARVVL